MSGEERTEARVYACPECGGEAYLNTTAAYEIETDFAVCMECDWRWDEGTGTDLPPGFLESGEATSSKTPSP